MKVQDQHKIKPDTQSCQTSVTRWFYFLFPMWYNFLIIEELTGNQPSINAYKLIRDERNFRRTN